MHHLENRRTKDSCQAEGAHAGWDTFKDEMDRAMEQM